MRNSTAVLMTVCALLVITCSIVTASPDANRSISVQKTTTISTDNKSQSMVEIISLRGLDKLRLDRSAGSRTEVRIFNGADFWVYSLATKKGFHKKLSPKEQKAVIAGTHVGPDLLNEFIKSGGKKAAPEKVEGVLYDAYKKTDKNGMTITYLVSKDALKLARRETAFGIVQAADAPGRPMGTHQIRTTSDYRNWQIGKPIPDSQFRPPVGIVFQEINQPIPTKK